MIRVLRTMNGLCFHTPWCLLLPMNGDLNGYRESSSYVARKRLKYLKSHKASELDLTGVLFGLTYARFYFILNLLEYCHDKLQQPIDDDSMERKS